MPPYRFADRRDAGVQLAARLQHYAGRSDVVVLGLPRGGVPVAAEIARWLQVPFDVFVVRKIGAPWQRELAIGAIAEGGIEVHHEEAMRSLGVSPADLAQVAAVEHEELRRRVMAYRGERPLLPLTDRTVILVDDGLATGSTLEAAIAAVRLLHPARMVVAVPVGVPDSCARIEAQVDELVCPLRPRAFRAVGEWYDNFGQITDDEVRALLAAGE